MASEKAGLLPKVAEPESYGSGSGGTTDPESGTKPEPEKTVEPSTPSIDPMKQQTGTKSCGDYFGVRSYLHQFYDKSIWRDPHLYEDEDDDERYLLGPRRRRRRAQSCTSIWWKVFVWIGANLLIFGIIGVLVGYLVPQRAIFVGDGKSKIKFIDREAEEFNFNLDVCKLVGLVLFCVGGLTLTVALLVPSLMYHYCEDDRRDDSFKVTIQDAPKIPPKSPVEMTIPSCSKLRSVQPERKGDESVVIKHGMVPLAE